MAKLETELFNILEIPTLLGEAGLSDLINPRLYSLLSQNSKKSNPRKLNCLRMNVNFQGSTKNVFVDCNNGLVDISLGSLPMLLKQLAHSVEFNGDFTAPDLMSLTTFKRACLSEIEFTKPNRANKFIQELSSVEDNSIPVFYGSTAGINFAEVLETIICSETIIKKGINSSIVFDYDPLKSNESDAIYVSSLTAMPPALKERAINFKESFPSGLIGPRLESVKQLLKLIEPIPDIKFIDNREITKTLENRFTLGQLFLLAHIAGQNPRLFSRKGIEINYNEAISNNVSSNFPNFVKRNQISLMKKPISEIPYKPSGFTLYARDTVIGRIEGQIAIPFKLTDKANIYKIMYPANALYRPETEHGMILLPLTRQRIQSKLTYTESRPIDPIVLNILAQNEPVSFLKLIEEFNKACQVLTPDESIKAGTISNKFFIEDYFTMEAQNG